MKKVTKLLALVLALIMCLGALPMSASANYDIIAIGFISVEGITEPVAGCYAHSYGEGGDRGWRYDPSGSFWVETDTEPVLGEIPVGTEYYNDDDLVFNKDKYYTFVARFGITYEGLGTYDEPRFVDPRCAINNERGKVLPSYSDANATAIRYFGKPKEVVSSISVVKDSQPFVGDDAVFNDIGFFYTPGANFHLDSNKVYSFWSETDTKPQTYEDVQSGTLYDNRTDLVFKANKYYTVAFYVEPLPGYQFADEPYVSLDGNTAKYEKQSDYSVVWYCYGVAQSAIDKVYVSGVKAPGIGEKASWNWYSQSSLYGMDMYGSRWIETDEAPDDDYPLLGDEYYEDCGDLTFKNDKYYTFMAVIEPKDNHTLASNATVYMNNKRAEYRRFPDGSYGIWYCFGKPKNLIESVSVTGVSAPVRYESADYNCAVPNNAGYEKYGTTEWIETDYIPNLSSVNAGTHYTASDNLKFKPSKFYTFYTRVQLSDLNSEYIYNPTVTVNGKEAEYVISDGVLSIYWYYGYPSINIDSFPVSAVSAPVTGAAASYNWSVALGAAEAADQNGDDCGWLETSSPVTAGGTDLSQAFSDGNFYTASSDTLTFKADKYYTFFAFVNPKASFRFADDVTATLNGNPAWVEGGNYGSGELSVVYSFGQPGTAITHLEVKNIAEPIIGQTASFSWTCPTGYGYGKGKNTTGEDCYWAETTFIPTSLDDLRSYGVNKYYINDVDLIFKADKYYTFVAFFEPDTGRTFPSAVTSTVNGNESAASIDFGTFAVVWYCFGKPTEHPNYTVKSIDVVKVTQPYAGEISDWYSECSFNINTTLSGNTYWVETDSEPQTYSDVAAGTWHEWVANGFPFNADKYYTFVRKFNPSYSYSFSANPTATVNGKAAQVSMDNSSAMVWYCFGKPIPVYTIDSVKAMNVAQPVAAAQASFDYTLFDHVGYRDNNSECIVWVETITLPQTYNDLLAGQFYNDGDSLAFKADKYYTALVVAAANTGFAFSNSTSGSINGNTADFKFVDAGSGVMWYCFGKPATVSDVKTLSSISVTAQPTKTAYTAGESFETAGMVVKANYTDGTSATITGYTVTNGSSLTAGRTSVTVSYTQGGVTRVATVPITVTGYIAAPTPTIAIKNNPGTREINYGDAIKFTAVVTDMPAGAQIKWYVNGAEKGTGNTFTFSDAKADATITVKIVDGSGNALTEAGGGEISDTQTIKVKAGFFQKLISFFKNLFRVDRIIAQAVASDRL